VKLVAPEGKLISAYCIKSGSANQGEGPKIVTLDTPVAELVIAYPTTNRGGKNICRGISHYAVAYVDAPKSGETTPPTGEETTPPENPGTPEEPGTPEQPEQPGTPEEPGTPEQPENPGAPEEPGTPEQPGTPVDETLAEPTPSDEPSALPTAPTDGSTPGMGGADYEDAATVVDEVSTGDGTVGSAQEQSAAVAAPDSLPVTGAQVLGFAMAAVALLGAGAGALIWVRQRRAS
ncbi:hypothetical protein ACFU5J_21910, partial [Isoptericola sp. NPDC057559]